jgi:insulysin
LKVGHESEGSLLSELKKKGWCNNLIADGQRVARGFQFFTINFGLTDKGIENVEEIMKHVFQYLNMLRKEKPQKWIFNEMNDLGNFICVLNSIFKIKICSKTISFT